jgi:hypothetical protein
MFVSASFPLNQKKLVDHGQKAKLTSYSKACKEQNANAPSKATRCLICATPCCSAHLSKPQEFLTVCTDSCKEVFHLILSWIVSLGPRDKLPLSNVERMVDL